MVTVSMATDDTINGSGLAIGRLKQGREILDATVEQHLIGTEPHLYTQPLLGMTDTVG
jgi:hypothetical protein